MHCAPRIAAAASVLLLFGCSGNDDTSPTDSTGGGGTPGSGGESPGPSGCDPTELVRDGQCITVGSFEPDERIDFDNVANYSGEELTLDLPDPPKSGFRLIVPPQPLDAAEEINGCTAWDYPEFTHKNVYAARLYTNGALHHSNMYGMPLGAEGASSYPDCAAGQTDLVAQVPNWFEGNILDVLFANSTQVDGGEAIIFPEGMAFKVTTEGREIATSIHWLNPRTEAFTSEVVYDFYTMPDDQVVEELVPFVFDNQTFSVPPATTSDVTTTCDITPMGNMVSMMPHTHKRTTGFSVDLIDASGTAQEIFTSGGYDSGSDIVVFDEPITLEGHTQLRYTCKVANELSDPLSYGPRAEDEMCTLFGYLYPPSAQQLGVSISGMDGCTSLYIGQYR